MRGSRLRSSVGLLTLCVASAVLFDCTLETDGAFIDPGAQGTGGTGFEGSGGSDVGGGSSGTGGAGVGGSETGNMGTGGGSTGAAGVSGGGNGGSAGGTNGSAGAGQGGGGAGGAGGAGPTLPDVLGCTPWLPDNPTWAFAGDAARDAEGKRILLTPSDGSNHWGQAYLNLAIDPDDRIDIAFTFAFEGTSANNYDEGAAAWFARGSSVSDPPGGLAQAHLGVPDADIGGALALDMHDANGPTTPAGGPFWAMYPSANGGSTLGRNVGEESENGSDFLAASGLVPQGPHTATLRMVRGGGPFNRLDMTATIAGVSANPALALSENESDYVFDGGRVGFSAGSVAGGAVHALLGIEIAIDDVCFNPP
jgi:hypothetical protein